MINQTRQTRQQRLSSRQAWTIPELIKTYGMSRGFWAKAIRDRKLRGHRFGRRLLVLEEDLEAYVRAALV